MTRSKLALCGVAAVAAVALMTTVTAGASGQGSNPTVEKVSGNAWAAFAQVSVLGVLNVNVPETPKVALPHDGQGGQFSASVVNLLPLLGVLNVATGGATGPQGYSHSSADIATVDIPGVVTALAIHSECTAKPSGVDTKFQVLALKVLGIPVTTSTTVTDLLGNKAVIAIDQVVNNSTPSTGKFTGHVNAVAVDITLTGLINAHITLAHSHCDLIYRTDSAG